MLTVSCRTPLFSLSQKIDLCDSGCMFAFLDQSDAVMILRDRKCTDNNV